MATKVTVKWKGEELPIDMGRNSLTLQEAMQVEKISGVPFFATKPGEPVPLPVWSAQLLVQIRRHDSSATVADVQALHLDAVTVHVLPDEPSLVDGGDGSPDPTDGEGSSTEPSPPAETSTSASSRST